MHSSTHASRRRRSALTVSGAAALLVAAPLLTACGNDAHAGAAAVADGERITLTQLQSRVKDVREAQRSAPQGQQLIKGSGQLTRVSLSGLLQERIVARTAKDAGVSVTRSDIEKQQALLQRQMGGEKRFKDTMLMQYGIAPGQIGEFMRTQVEVQKLAKKLRIDTRTPQGGAALQKKLSETAKAMHISVNPRYGKWDLQKGALGEGKETWLRDLTGAQKDREQQQPVPGHQH